MPSNKKPAAEPHTPGTFDLLRVYRGMKDKKPAPAADRCELAEAEVEKLTATLASYARDVATLERERDEARAEAERLRKYAQSLAAAVEGFIENVARPPEQNCSCHLSPPCDDCVDYASLREAFEFADAALAAKGVNRATSGKQTSARPIEGNH